MQIHSHAPSLSPPSSPKTDDVLRGTTTASTATKDTFEPIKTEALEPLEPLPELPESQRASTPSRLRRSWDFFKSSINGASALLMQGGRLVANAVLSVGQAAGESITSFVSRFTKKAADTAESAADGTKKAADDLASDAGANVHADSVN